MRLPGYYWVKALGKWTVEEWDGSTWNDHGSQDGNDYYISFFEEIDERRIERESGLTIGGLKIIYNDALPPGAIVFKDTGNGYERIK